MYSTQKPFQWGAQWQDIHGFRVAKTVRHISMIISILFEIVIIRMGD